MIKPGKNESFPQINVGKYVKRGVIGLVGFCLLMGTFSIVTYGHVGFRKTMGSLSSEMLGQGPHFKIPFIQSVVSVNVQVDKFEGEASASSKDLQPVHTKVAVNYRIDEKTAYELLTNVGASYEAKIIAPSIQEVVKEVTAKYSAEELISKRETVASEVRQTLTARLGKYDLQVQDINIVNFEFSKAFNDSIEAKQVAAQQAMKAENDLKRIEVEAKQQIEQAKAEAEALRLKKQEVTPDLISLKQIEVQQKAIEVQQKAIDKWNGQLPQVTGQASPFISLPALAPAQAEKK